MLDATAPSLVATDSEVSYSRFISTNTSYTTESDASDGGVAQHIVAPDEG